MATVLTVLTPMTMLSDAVAGLIPPARVVARGCEPSLFLASGVENLSVAPSVAPFGLLKGRIGRPRTWSPPSRRSAGPIRAGVSDSVWRIKLLCTPFRLQPLTSEMATNGQE